MAPGCPSSTGATAAAGSSPTSCPCRATCLCSASGGTVLLMPSRPSISMTSRWTTGASIRPTTWAPPGRALIPGCRQPSPPRASATATPSLAWPTAFFGSARPSSMLALPPSCAAACSTIRDPASPPGQPIRPWCWRIFWPRPNTDVAAPWPGPASPLPPTPATPL